MASQNQNHEQLAANRAVMMDLDAHEWNTRIDSLIAQDARIITFRGAGTVNGIDPSAAKAATETLVSYVSKLTENGTPVALMFDGDADNRAKPDVGSIFGGTVDAFHDDPRVIPITAQSKGWYEPKVEGGALGTSTGKPYETFVFPDELPGGHASLTQSEKLVGYSGYEQVFIGPAGPIAFDQLRDLSVKTAHRPAEAGPVKVTIFETPNNMALTQELTGQLELATDGQTRAKISAKIAQREIQPYGALFNQEGAFAVDTSEYPGIAFNVGSIEVK